jgi:non-specific serine/threonine protein kinase
VELFVKRSQAVDPGFVLTAGNAPAVAEICVRLDGLPLAIELAATRNRLLPPAALAMQLDQPLDLLTDGPRDLPRRHQSLRAALAWSYDLLGAQEQWLLRQLAVFEGGFSLAACTAVCCPEASCVSPASSLDTLRTLLDKSLVERDETSPYGEPRFRLLHTTRHFAREQLDVRPTSRCWHESQSAERLATELPGNAAEERVDRLRASVAAVPGASGEEELARQRHAEYFVGLAVAADAELLGPDQRRAVARLDLELDNARAALRWLAQSGPVDLELRLATALAGYWQLRGQVEEAYQTLDSALVRGTAVLAAVRAAALAAASGLALARGDRTSAALLAESCLEVAHQAGDQRARCVGLACLAVARLRLGDRGRGRAAARESLDLARDLGQPDLLVHALQHLAEVTLALGNDDAALSLYAESLRVAHELGDSWRAARALEGLAMTVARQGRSRLTLRLAGAAAGLREDLGASLHPAERDRLDAELAAARAALGEEPASSAESEGRALPLEQLVREVGELDDGTVVRESASALPDRIPLSRREREVAVLVARGHSNRQIAQRLSISPRTAGVHVGNILGKLALDSRTQLASWVLRKGLPG